MLDTAHPYGLPVYNGDIYIRPMARVLSIIVGVKLVHRLDHRLLVAHLRQSEQLPLQFFPRISLSSSLKNFYPPQYRF